MENERNEVGKGKRQVLSTNYLLSSKFNIQSFNIHHFFFIRYILRNPLKIIKQLFCEGTAN